VSFNCTTITQAGELYNYHSYHETILTYGSDADASHLTNAFGYPDSGDILPCDPKAADAKNKDFITRWNRIKQSKEVQLYGRLHCDICNVPQYTLPGVGLQITLIKAKQNVFLKNKSAD
jgi:hypothetical protein